MDGRMRPVSRRRALTSLTMMGLAGCLRLTAESPEAESTPTTERPDQKRAADRTTSSIDRTATPTEDSAGDAFLERRWETSAGGRHIFFGESKIYHSGEGVGAIEKETGEKAWYALFDQPNNRTDAFVSFVTPVVEMPSGAVLALGTDGPREQFTLFAIDEAGLLVEKRNLEGPKPRLLPGPNGAFLDQPAERKHEVSTDGVTVTCDVGGGRISHLAPPLDEQWSVERPREMCGIVHSVATGSHLLVKDDQYLRAFEIPEGKLLWRTPVDVSGRHFVVDERYAYVPTLNDGLVKYELATGDRVWTFDPGSDREADRFRIARAGDQLFAQESELVALDVETGEPNWTAAVRGKTLARPRFAAGSLWAFTDELVGRYDAADGTAVDEMPIPRFVLDGDQSAVHVDASGVYLRGGEILRKYVPR